MPFPPDIVIAYATVIYTVSALALLILSWRQIRLTSEIFEWSNRPYLAIHGVRVSRTGEHREVEIDVRNSGKTPAREVRLKITMNSGDHREIPVMTASPTTVFPEQFALFTAKLPDYAAPVEIIATCSYKGVTNRFLYHQQTIRCTPDGVSQVCASSML
jgi:hypothetical protein